MLGILFDTKKQTACVSHVGISVDIFLNIYIIIQDAMLNETHTAVPTVYAIFSNILKCKYLDGRGQDIHWLYNREANNIALKHIIVCG